MKFFNLALYAIIVSTILFLIDRVFSVTYIYGVIGKILFFVIIPLLIGLKYKGLKGKLGKISTKSFLYGGVFGVIGVGIIIFAYFIFRDLINWGDIYASMQSRNITKTTFIFVFLYIMFFNSLIEEYFFRAFVFYNISKINKKIAYIFSSLLFSLYHLSIFSSWFTGIVMLLALIGLFISGLFFAFLYDKTKSVWGAYIFHILADLVIVVIGYLIFFY